MRVTIIGCGISGLTTGVLLSEKGYEVDILTEKLPHDTVSAKAAAIWLPYEIKPVEAANRWSIETYQMFETLSQTKETGIKMAVLTVFLEQASDAWWKDAFPADKLSELTSSDIDPQYLPAYRGTVPIAETQIYLDYMMNRFTESGGNIVLKKINDLSQLLDSENVVVNCTGLGARELMTDREMYPIYGQIVKVDRIEGVQSMTDEKISDKPQNEVAYIVERSDCLVLGGTVMKGRESDEVNADYTQRIIERCQVMEPKIISPKIQSVVGGLRPGRTSVRLERDGNLIHNYGHGGSGYTVSWGCAGEVLRLIREIPSS
ncbi:MAG: FAD-dependent oxidoreductase [Cyclobacteriaceae bacterium]